NCQRLSIFSSSGAGGRRFRSEFYGYSAHHAIPGAGSVQEATIIPSAREKTKRLRQRGGFEPLPWRAPASIMI
ncbi:MAG: hypothetical protein ACK2UA_03385, partial [Anaerolineae bacterium]